MTRGFLVVFGLLFILSACTQRLICPVYQSSFIYDKEALRQKFSYFKEDSTPKILTASKNKYLIAVPESYRKTYRKMKTIEMKPVYPKISDSLKVDQDPGLLLAERDVIDSTMKKQTFEPGDSAYAITKTKEKYNLDQDLYMWYFREMLVLPDVRAAMDNNLTKKNEEATGKEVKKEKLGFFKSLKSIFKKKQKRDSISTTIDPTVKTKTGVNAPDQQKKKGGLFKKMKSDQPEKKKDPAKKKDNGDGF